MPDDDSFQEVMGRLEAGDEDAARQIVLRFANRLIALAGTHLDARLRQKVDPEDVLQSVYKSFFLRHAQGKFELKNWESLWGLLTLITLRKCGRWRERFLAAGRDVRAEVRPAAGEDDSSSWQALDRSPLPEEVFELVETLEQLLRGLDPLGRQIVGLALQGSTAQEISGELGCSERMVYRILKVVRQRLERMRDSAAQES